LARSGRVRDLWFAPGIAHAEVVTNKEAYRVSVRVRVFEDGEWTKVIHTLLKNLTNIAAMLEGQLSETLIHRLESKDINLLPTLEELDGDCECQDFHLPCCHTAAVHNLLADALDGDPFLLLTLRGRNREQLMAELRRAWKDDVPLLPMTDNDEVAPPEGDWSVRRSELPSQGIQIELITSDAIGINALGPPPGEVDLGPALAPLYRAGARAAYKQAMADPGDIYREIPKYGWVREWTGETPRPIQRRAGFGTERSGYTGSGSVQGDKSSHSDLTEVLVDFLAEMESAKSKELADRLGVSLMEVRQELLELEKLGIVYRTGHTRGTRWWLG